MVAEVEMDDQLLNDFKHLLLIAGQTFTAKRNKRQAAPALIISGPGVCCQADAAGISVDLPRDLGIVMYRSA